MNLKEIQKYQREFDTKFFSRYWKNGSNVGRKIESLKDMTLALVGETGEFTNLVKKISRDWSNLNQKPSDEMLEKLREELTDCFIYLIILSNIVEMDIEKRYLKKLKYNEKRFEKYLKR